MKIRTIYFKVSDVKGASAFWEKLLGVKPHKTFDSWHEFMCGNVRLGLLLNDFGDQFSGVSCVPVFEFADDELASFIKRAKDGGAKIIVDGLEDPKMKSLVMQDPFGNEFELSKFHD